jgi:hypothetical protein
LLALRNRRDPPVGYKGGPSSVDLFAADVMAEVYGFELSGRLGGQRIAYNVSDKRHYRRARAAISRAFRSLERMGLAVSFGGWIRLTIPGVAYALTIGERTDNVNAYSDDQ